MDSIPLRVGQLEERHAGQGRRAADENVQGAETLDRAPDEGAGRFGLGEVGGQRDGGASRPTGARDEVVGERSVAVVVHRDVGAGVDQGLGNRPADTSRPRAGDQRPLAL